MHAENLQTINNIHWPSPKGRKFMVKEIRKASVIKFKKKSLGLTEIKFRKLVSKNWKNTDTKREFL